MRIKPFSHRKTISLALQGGGAHGAFTWGVLDYLLEAGQLEFDAVSGTSAGAMNAAVLAQGVASGGAASGPRRRTRRALFLRGASPARARAAPRLPSYSR